MHLTVLVALQVTMLPSSPAELLRHIQSDGYKQAQADPGRRGYGEALRWALSAASCQMLAVLR